eukprot:CAMPEP_0175938630 /NCGR_PEP_ID=MMETSP0108-20121206/22803_1 /TAXON_ID=195067 ORGANISM="Goniomonas pacifica, Strain CCMP1869" /NCGR_SAMPLE_ID=MMETSP0108 /ASSEMBLY_ACC=CAM_ASM_000204 /LENGTH=348 /DNA_ID=CAMNT_0017262903 /DNA_START=17 /DNA_END=1063 /DNA_ORIENTATION=-
MTSNGSWAKAALSPNRHLTMQSTQINTSSSVRYQIKSGILYRDQSTRCAFPQRCNGVEHLISRALRAHGVPDMEFLVNVFDHPKALGGNQQAPILSFSRATHSFDLMYPSWAFWKGGPCIASEPGCIGRWDRKRQVIADNAQQHSWDKKESVLFFRGSRTNRERDSVVKLGLKDPKRVDAKYTKNQSWRSVADSLGQEPVPEVRLEDHCSFKYLFNSRGVAASFRHRHLFMCGSLVFDLESDWAEFYYAAMKPWVHYVPVAQGATDEETMTNIESLLTFFQEHDNLARQIAHNGQQFIAQHLRMNDVTSYWSELLRELYLRQPWKWELAPTAVKVHDATVDALPHDEL